MQIEMTPHGRYLYSIGKFKPHSYEFVDDDILYKASGSTEEQEAAHQRILNETPRIKVNRAFQNSAPQQDSPPTLDKMRVMNNKQDLKQSGLYALGRSSYSNDRSPSFQVTMLSGEINESSMYDDAYGEDLPIPQVDIDLKFIATLKNTLTDLMSEEAITSNFFDDGTYVEIHYTEPIIHLKEFNSFYEKENFEIEVFETTSTGQLRPLKMSKKMSSIVNGILVDDEFSPDREQFDDSFLEDDAIGRSDLEYFFDIDVDEDIPPEIICEVVDRLEINNQFLDEELLCPDKRTDMFNIYATKIGPEDLEDCD